MFYLFNVSNVSKLGVIFLSFEQYYSEKFEIILKPKMRTILISALLACFVAMLDARSVAGTIVVVFLFNFFLPKTD